MVEEFINLRQGSMSVKEYSLKFTLLSKYATSLVSNPRDDMSRFVTGVSDLIKEESRTAMIHDYMNISRLIVYAQSIEESKLERKSRGIDPMSKINLGPKRGSTTKILQW